jgi:acyl-lipid omega-6 desaturase (Delta-12 desaturase)
LLAKGAASFCNDAVTEFVGHQVRAQLPPELRRRSQCVGVLLFACTFVPSIGLFAAVLVAPELWLKATCGVLLGIAISALFVVGHDACHDSLTPSHRLNEVLGRISFLPTLHPFACWELGHNRLHHGWTNLKGRDYVYTPFSTKEFAALPWWRRWLEGAYRSVAGIGLFYLIEVWWKHMIVPRPDERAKLKRAIWIQDLTIVLVFLLAQIAVAVISARSMGEALVNVMFAIALPYAIWNWLMAFVTIQHHTHPQSPWFEDVEQWEFFHAQIHGTIHVKLPRLIELLFHNILDHTAHHVDPKIPLYNLPQSQERLESRYGERILIQQGSIPALHRVLTQCKLYDYKEHRWLDFRGRPTGPRIELERWQLNSRPVANSQLTSA